MLVKPAFGPLDSSIRQHTRERDAKPVRLLQRSASALPVPGASFLHVK
jgi:hypothetical protein